MRTQVSQGFDKAAVDEHRAFEHFSAAMQNADDPDDHTEGCKAKLSSAKAAIAAAATQAAQQQPAVPGGSSDDR